MSALTIQVLLLIGGTGLQILVIRYGYRFRRHEDFPEKVEDRFRQLEDKVAGTRELVQNLKGQINGSHWLKPGGHANIT